MYGYVWIYGLVWISNHTISTTPQLASFQKEFTFVLKDVMKTKPTRGIPTTAVMDFNGRDYGDEYLTFKKDARIDVLPTPDNSSGWAYGLHSGTSVTGWFPPTYIL